MVYKKTGLFFCSAAADPSWPLCRRRCCWLLILELGRRPRRAQQTQSQTAEGGRKTSLSSRPLSLLLSLLWDPLFLLCSLLVPRLIISVVVVLWLSYYCWVLVMSYPCFHLSPPASSSPFLHLSPSFFHPRTHLSDCSSYIIHAAAAAARISIRSKQLLVSVSRALLITC